MKNIIMVAFVVILGFCSHSARGDTVMLSDMPDISGWIIVDLSRIELIISDRTTAYIGLKIEYRNPANSREFARVVRRHIPLIIFRQKESGERMLNAAASNLLNKQEEEARLNKLIEQSDSVVYIYGRTKANPRTGKDMPDGDINVCILASSGNWFCDKNKDVGIEFLSENVGNGKPRNVFTGMEYGIDEIRHINRIDRNDLKRLFDRVSPKASAVAQEEGE